jgi:hypothetical protein
VAGHHPPGEPDESRTLRSMRFAITYGLDVDWLRTVIAADAHDVILRRDTLGVVADHADLDCRPPRGSRFAVLSPNG